MNYSDTKELNKELEDVIINFSSHHNSMEEYNQFYNSSAFYEKKTGDLSPTQRLYVNMLKVFANKNIYYTSQLPKIKVPTTGADQQARQSASIREKILNAVHQKSGSAILQAKWAKDATVKSVAVAETGFDVKKRCAFVRRYRPNRVFWQMSNTNENRVIAFWAVYLITSDECMRRYGKKPTSTGHINLSSINHAFLNKIDGRDWHVMAIRWDENTRVSWVGDQIIEEPHNHLLGEVPIDIATPFDTEDDEADARGFGAFYLKDLVPLQAELNDKIITRARIVKRLGNPLIWASGLNQTGLDDIKEALTVGSSGTIGLKKDGQLGLLQASETRMVDQHIVDILNHMMRVSGFSAAAFGETVGANTSGDALGMYFTPTQRLIEHQNIYWKSFWASINAKILKSYDRFGMIGEQFTLSGYAQQSTLLGVSDSGDRQYEKSGFYSVTFDKSVINGAYDSLIMMPTVTPKNEEADRRFWLDAANLKQVSKTTAYENIGIESPEDELELLKAEQSEPILNPDGTQKILQSAQPQLMSPQPIAGDLANGTQSN